MTTPLEQMQTIAAILQTLFERLQWQGDAESIELANDALNKINELMEQEELLSEIF